MIAHCADCSEHFHATAGETRCDSCITKTSDVVDHFADRLITYAAEDQIDVTCCAGCSHYFELTGPDGLVPHTLASHPDSMLARVARMALEEA
jgi:hypothetical protein